MNLNGAIEAPPGINAYDEFGNVVRIVHQLREV